MCKSYKYNLLPNIAMPTDVHGKYILHLRQSIYWRSVNIIDFPPYFLTNIEECNTTWITLYFKERIFNVQNNRFHFVVFVVTNENKTKKIEGLVHVRVVHLSYPTGLSPTDWSSLFCPSPHSLVISATFVKTWVRNVPM